MKKSLTLLTLGCISVSSFALEQPATGRVISSKPITHQFQVPQQFCSNTPVAVAEPKSGAGAVLGAIAGGAVGSAVGQGSGNAAATAIGMVSGAVLGDKMEGQGSVVQNATTCATQMVTQSVTVYQVEYEYAGRRYKVELPNDPGKSIELNVSPAASAQPLPPPGYPAPTVGAAPPGEAGQPVVMSPQAVPSAPVYVVPYPAYGYPYAYPYGYPYGYYPPVGVHFGFGYYRGGYRR